MNNSLTEFQNQLSLAIRGANSGQDLFVAITLDEDRWLVDLSAIREASVPPKVARSVGAPSWVLGIGNFKGEVWSVLDMRALLHGEETFNPRYGWVTLLHPVNNHEVALLWSEIVEIAPKTQYTLHHATEDKHRWSKNVWSDKNGNLWNEFNVGQLTGPGGLIENWIGQQSGQTAPSN